MALIFHTIWLGGAPPLRALDHLAHLLTLPADDGSLPLLWLDRSAWGALLRQAPLPVEACAADRIPAAFRQCTDALLGQPSPPLHWLALDHPRHGSQPLPVLLLEELGADLAEPWRDLKPALETLRGVGESAAGRAFLVEELAYLQTLIDHGRRQWAAHGLLCLPSDLLRLLALVWRPGAYGDLGDVAGRLPRLPVARDAGPDGFCAHHTVAVENDLIVATDRLLLQAITLATALWSWPPCSSHPGPGWPIASIWPMAPRRSSIRPRAWRPTTWPQGMPPPGPAVPSASDWATMRPSWA